MTSVAALVISVRPTAAAAAEEAQPSRGAGGQRYTAQN